jgi:hypothetical protein
MEDISRVVFPCICVMQHGKGLENLRKTSCSGCLVVSRIFMVSLTKVLESLNIFS